MSKIYWVSFEKYAGVAVRAETEEEAEQKALEMDEDQYEFGESGMEEWNLCSAVEITEEWLGDKWKGI